MANSDKNIRITTNNGTTALPKIAFTGQSNSPITLYVLDDNTLSFEGSSGQLFSINNVLSSGYIFAINDISGIPSFRINADGTVGIAEFTGSVGVGLTNPSYKFHVNGSAGFGASIWSSPSFSSSISGVTLNNGAITSTGAFSTTGRLSVQVSDTAALAVKNSGGTSIFNVDTTNGITSVLSSTATTSTTTGALVVTGGVGIGQSVNIGGRVGIGTNLLAGQINIRNATAATPSIVIQGATSQSADYFQINSSTGTTAFLINSSYQLAWPSIGTLKVYGSAYSSTGRLQIDGCLSVGTGPFLIDTGSGQASMTSSSLTFVGGIGLATYSSNTLSTNNPFRVQPTDTSVIPIVINAQNASWTSGNLFLIQNNGSNVFSVNFAGSTSIASTTVSNSTTSGALVVSGGVGISGRLSFSQAAFGTTGISPNPTMAMIGNTGDPIYMSVLEDNSISFEGSQGQLFSITPNLSTGYIYSVNDITGIPLLRANANANVTANEYAGNFGIGLSNPNYKLHVIGSVGFTSNINSTSSSTGTLVVGGGVGIAGTANIGSNAFIGGNLSVTGNLTVNGTTTTIESTVSTLADPIFVLGAAAGGTQPYIDDNKDRGIEFRYFSGTGKTGFFGFQDSTGKFTFIPDGSNSGEVFSGAAGTAVFGTIEATAIIGSTFVGVTFIGTATTASNVSIANAASNLTHRILFTPNSTTSGSAISSDATFSFNPSTEILSVSGIAVTATTGSSSTSTGALTVAGSVGIGGTVNIQGDETVFGRLYYTQSTVGIAGTTVIPSISFIGQNNNPISLSVLSDNTLSFEGSSGQLFSINNNLSSGTIFSVNDISGIPILRANANGTLSMGEFSSSVGVGLSLPSFKFQVSGSAGFSGTVFISGNTFLASSTTSTSTSTGALVISGGVGIGGSLNVNSASNISGVVLNSGNIIGNLIGTATTASNVNVNAALTNANHFLIFSPNATGAGVALSSEATLLYNPSTDILYASGIAVTSSLGSTNSSTGALVVTGGVGIGGTLNVGSRLNVANTIDYTATNSGIANTWTRVSIPSPVTISGLAYGNGLYVGVGYSAVTSIDGFNWTARSLPHNLTGVGYGNGLYVGVLSGSALGATSTDGITWRSMSLPSSTTWLKVAYGNGVYVANADSLAVAYSYNGFQWTSSSLYYPGGFTQGTPVEFGGGYFIIRANAQSAYWISNDGISWTYRTNFTSSNVATNSIAYGDGVWVLAGSSASLAYTRDLLNFTYSSHYGWSGSFNYIAYTNGTFAIVDANSLQCTLIYKNLSTIIASYLPGPNAATTITAGEGKFVAGNGSTVYVTDIASHSFNIFPNNSGELNNVRIGAKFPSSGQFTVLSSTGLASIGSTASSFSSSTGALVVEGGVGIGGSLFVGNTLSVGSSSGSTNSSTGALIISGGVGIGQSLNTSSSHASSISGVVLNNGSAILSGTYLQTNSGTTAFTVKNGGGTNVFNIDTTNSVTSVLSSTASTNTSTGAFVVTGSVGIGGTLNANSVVTYNKLQNQSFSGSSLGATDGRSANTGALIGHDKISYGNGVFVTNSSWGAYNAAYSTDGTSWTSSSLPVNQGYPINMYGNGYFVLVASGATNVLYSTNGTSWLQSSIGNTLGRTDGTYGNGKYIVVGTGETYNYSTNLTTWTSGTLPLTGDWRIAYGNGTFVALGYGTRKIIYSYDGIYWNIANTKVEYALNWTGLKYANGRFIASSYSGGGSAYSLDGINWYSAVGTAGENLDKISYGNGVYFVSSTGNYYTSGDGTTYNNATPWSVTYQAGNTEYGLGKFQAIGRFIDGPTNTVTIEPKFTGEINNVRIGAITPASGDFTNLSSTGSANLVGTVNAVDLNIVSKLNQTPVLGGFAGSTGWTSAGLLAGSNNNYALAFGNGLFVQVRKATNYTSYSPDGRQWVGSTMPFTGDWMSIAWGVDKFVAIASAGATGAYSGNGITWTSMNMPSNASGWYAVTYGDDKFVAVGNGATVAYSSDGITWTGSAIANTNWTGIAYGNGTFVAVSGNGSSGAYSYDGLNWNYSTLGGVNNGIKFITYGNGYFVVTNYVSTAINYSRDGINWSTSTRTSTYSIHTDLAYGNGVYSIFNYQEASYSYDAINWLNGNTIAATDWQAVAYGNNRFVATSYNTSQVGSIDGPSNTLSLHPKFTGDIDNVRIGAKQPGAAEFTNLAAQQPVRFTANTTSLNTTSGALVVVGGVGIGQTLFTSASHASSVSGVILNNGTITGTLSGYATTSNNIRVVGAGNSNLAHPVLFTPVSSSSGSAVSSDNTFFFNSFTEILSVSGLAVTASTASTSSTTGALIVTGGVGVGATITVGLGVSTPVLSSPSNLIIKPGVDSTTAIQLTRSSTALPVITIDTLNSRVGIGVTAPEYDLEINGEISATTKSFLIPHPTKENMKLRYGSLEGPENGVYIRGELKDSNVIILPDYWDKLIDPKTITVHLTPIGNKTIFVKEIKDNKVIVGARLFQKIHCFYSVWAERKDVPKLKVEF